MISACIVNWNTRDHLLACLASLAESRTSDPLEVVVVDNASTDGSVEAVQRGHPAVRLIANRDNRGYAAGNNQAIAASTGEFVALLNPDVVLPPDGLETMAGFLLAHPEAAAVAPRLILPDGSVQRSVRGFPGPFEVFCELTRLSRVFPRSRRLARYWLPDLDYGVEQPVPQPMASCLMLRRADLERLGGFDEAFPIFFNDVDLSYRLHLSGRLTYLLPSVCVRHFHGASTRQVRREMAWESARSLCIYYRKHYRGRLSPLVYYPLVGLIRLAGAARWLASVPSRR